MNIVLGLRVLEGSERKPGEDSESKLLLLQPELALNNREGLKDGFVTESFVSVMTSPLPSPEDFRF